MTTMKKPLEPTPRLRLYRAEKALENQKVPFIPVAPTDQKNLKQLNVTKGETGGPKGPNPTRYGDWERNGRCIDF